MNIRHLFPAVFCALALSGWSQPVLAEASEPYPLEYFALRAVTSNVTVSPDGKRVAMLKILTRTGNPILHIYDTDDLDGDAFVVNADPMEITSYYWADDEYIVLTLRQRVRDMVKGPEDSVYAGRIAILDLVNEKFDDFDAAAPRVENILEGVPGKIIISEQPGMDQDLSLAEAFRPRAYYEMDLKKGTKQLLIRGKIDVGQIEFDSKGNPRVARGYDARTKDSLHLYRDPGEKDWEIVYRVKEDDVEQPYAWWYGEFLGFDDAIPGNLLVLAFNGDDKRGLWSFNPKTKTFDELLYRRSDVDVSGVRFHSNSWAYPDRVTAVSYSIDKHYFEYFDELEGATYRQLEELIPNAHYVRITSRSKDGDTLVAQNAGPHDPGTYYLYNKGEFKVIGSQQPLFDSDDLADVEYMVYEARDGRKIPAFVTMPKGEGPFPLIVLPHGGPHVSETIIYSEWPQMLANNGYLVIQPQYRMSMGHGLDHFTSGILQGHSEMGRKMQDDKDDGALYLIEQGLADPDRVAMFGWSYGGYAALVAASRTPQIYQCTIAGAAVADYVRSANDEVRGYKPTGLNEIWRDRQYQAVQPVDEVEKVNIPILLIHGSVDSRVLPKQARYYRKELEKQGKFHKFVELDGADHFSNTLFYDHQLTLYESIIDFLNNDCGNISKYNMQAKVSE